MRTITPASRNLLKHLEGERGGKPALVGYLDSEGNPTDGFGHTGPEVKLGRRITADQAESNLDKDLIPACQAVSGGVTIALNDNEFAALVIFAFNVGVTAFLKSTLLKQLNQGKRDAVPDQLKRWTRITDPVSKKKKNSVGLQARRTAEIALWLTPVTSHSAINNTAIAPQEQPQTRSTPTPPPQPTSVLRTSTGIAQAGAIAATAGGAIVQGVSQIQPVIAAVKDVSSSISGLPHALMIAGWIFAIAAIAFCGWTMWDRHCKLKTEGQ